MTLTVPIKSWKTGKILRQEPLPHGVVKTLVKEHLLSEVVRWQLASRRSGTHKTKSKGEVRGGGKKPFKQKGTGRARQGSIRSPLMPGGGKVFGPVPRSYSYALPKTVKKAALRMVIRRAVEEGSLHIFDEMESNGKTNLFFKALQSKGLNPSLIVVDSQENPIFRAARNIPSVKAIVTEGFNVFDALKYHALVFDLKNWQKFCQRLED